MRSVVRSTDLALRFATSIPWLLLGVVVLGPLAALVGAAGEALLREQRDVLLLAVPSARQMALLLRSVMLSALVALLDLTLGVLFVCAAWQLDGRLTWVRWLPLVMLAIPPYIHALAWNTLVYRLTLWSGVAPPPGFWMSVWVMAMALLPAGIGVALAGLETVSPALVDAARIRNNDTTVLWRIIVPLAGPLLAAGSGLIFLLSFADYSVPSLFGINTYALDIFAEFSASHSPARAFLASVPMLLLSIAVLATVQRLLRFAAQLPVHGASPWHLPPRWTSAFSTLQQIGLIVVVGQIAVPLIILFWLSWTGEGLQTTLRSAFQELWLSLLVAVATACLCLALAWMLVETRSQQRLNRFAVVLVFLPVAIPAPLTGIGLVALWNHPATVAFYDSAWMPVLAALARFAPLAVVLAIAQYDRIDPLMWDAARVFQASGLHTAWRIRLPLLAPGLVAGASLVFALTLGELGATLIVAPPGQSTLTMRIYNYLHYGASDVVAGLCLTMVLLMLTSGTLSALSLVLWMRHISGSRPSHPQS